MAKNGMHPDGIWSLPESTNSTETKKFLTQLKEKFKGARDAWKHLVFAGKVDFTSPQFSEKDILSLPKQERADKIIRGAFGHTESMADSTSTNVASAIQSHDKQFLGGTIWPALQNDAAFKNTQLIPDFGLDPTMYLLAYDNPIERDEAMYAERLGRDVDRGLRTRNEYRIEIGLPKSDDPNADLLLVNGMPLNAAPADPFAGLLGAGNPSTTPKPAQATEVDQGTTAPTGEGQEETVGTVDDEKAINRGRGAVDMVLRSWEEIPQWNSEKGCNCGITVKAQDPEEMAQDRILRDAMANQSQELEDSIADVLADSQESFLQRLYQAGPDADLSGIMADMAAQAASVFMVTMAPMLESAGQAQAAAIPGDVEGAFQITDERAAEFLRGYTVELADDIMGTTADIAKRATLAGLEQGMTENEVIEVMRENGIAENRARMIARTETQRAVQNGKRQAMLQNGIEEVIWINAPGARPSHTEIATRSPNPIDEPFVKAGETIKGDLFKKDVFVPPAGVNCRCSVRAVFKEDE